MDSEFLYGFLLGLNLGRFNGFLGSVIVSGVTLYVYNPDIYQYETLSLAVNTTLTAVETLKNLHF
jgi:hypothetical protein